MELKRKLQKVHEGLYRAKPVHGYFVRNIDEIPDVDAEATWASLRTGTLTAEVVRGGPPRGAGTPLGVQLRSQDTGSGLPAPRGRGGGYPSAAGVQRIPCAERGPCTSWIEMHPSA